MNITILPETMKNPITVIGRNIGICYGSDISDDAKNYKRGLSSIKAGHGRVLEFAEIYMAISGVSARTIRQWYTHIGGSPTRVQESTRYINYKDFKFVLPKSIKNNDVAYPVYINTMSAIRNAVETMQDAGVPKEDAALVLPLGMETGICCMHNARNIMDMSGQRKCFRTYWEYREIMSYLEEQLRAYSEEWDTLCDIIFRCKCDKAGFCLEEYSCGKYPKLDE